MPWTDVQQWSCSPQMHTRTATPLVTPSRRSSARQRRRNSSAQGNALGNSRPNHPICPEGAIQCSPPLNAGEYHTIHVSPFQGFYYIAVWGAFSPGRCPGLVSDCAVGARATAGNGSTPKIRFPRIRRFRLRIRFRRFGTFYWAQGPHGEQR